MLNDAQTADLLNGSLCPLPTGVAVTLVYALVAIEVINFLIKQKEI